MRLDYRQPDESNNEPHAVKDLPSRFDGGSITSVAPVWIKLAVRIAGSPQLARWSCTRLVLPHRLP